MGSIVKLLGVLMIVLACCSFSVHGSDTERSTKLPNGDTEMLEVISRKDAELAKKEEEMAKKEEEMAKKEEEMAKKEEEMAKKEEEMAKKDRAITALTAAWLFFFRVI